MGIRGGGRHHPRTDDTGMKIGNLKP